LIIGEPFEVHLPTYVSLGVITVILAASITASLRADKRDRASGILPPKLLPVADAEAPERPGGVDPDREPSSRQPEH
ncbi:MAG: hypothetical protein WD225_05650, partial [Ilumatobacteraceae bacterium]